MRRKVRLPSTRGLIAALVLITGCAGSAATTSTTVLVQSTTTLPASTTTVAPTTTSIAPDAAPPELSGVWVTEMTTGEALRLSLRGTFYTASVVGTPESGNGRIAVEGDTIRFYGSDRCPEDPGGTYTWTIEGETLTFTLIGEDPCGRKGSFLVGFTFTFLSDIP